MKERPILFSGPMVRAILDGRKTQTRRIVKPQPSYDFGWYPGCGNDGKSLHYANESHWIKGAPIDWSPYGQPGDRLWVRENWFQNGRYVIPSFPDAEPDDAVWSGSKTIAYEADGDIPESRDDGRVIWRKRPSIHMFRWASRITLEITDVRVERLQDISEEDAKREGVNKYDVGPIGGMYVDYEARQPVPADGPIHSFKTLWQSINGPGSWDANPWVWVVEFNRVTGDI